MIGDAILENKFLKLQQKVLACSNSKNWEDATLEWDIIDFSEDASMAASCKCGQRNIKYLYTISNKKTGNILKPIGSKCIERFDRDDLKEEISIYERLFKLLKAREDGEFIELKSDKKYFSKKLIDYLHEQNVFTINEQYNYYKVLRKFFTQRKELTDKQKNFARRIIMTDIVPYLDSEIKSRVKHDSVNNS